MNRFFLLFVLLLTGCGCHSWIRIVEFGNNFALVEADDTSINYDYYGGQNCFLGKYSAEVIPIEVLAYNYNERWIIAKSGSEHRPQEATYWIVNKDFNFTRLGFHNELKKQTIGPLDSLQFYEKMKEFNIDLKLKDSKK